MTSGSGEGGRAAGRGPAGQVRRRQLVVTLDFTPAPALRSEVIGAIRQQIRQVLEGAFQKVSLKVDLKHYETLQSDPFRIPPGREDRLVCHAVLEYTPRKGLYGKVTEIAEHEIGRALRSAFELGRFTVQREGLPALTPTLVDARFEPA
jgi:hypothetical protein